MQKTKCVYNDDASTLWDVEPGRAKESLIELINRVVDNVPIDTYTIECALPDMCEYQTKVGEVAGERFGNYDPKLINQRIRGIQALKAEGTDHLSVYLEHLHSRGIKCLAEVRMGDTHHPFSYDSTGCPMFTLNNPEWIIKRDDGIQDVAMDYSIPEVREHRLKIIEELINEYDIDGIELNFNRWGKYFERKEAPGKIPIMTEYVGQVRKMLNEASKRKNKKMQLGVWMMSTVEECLNAGCDPETWAKNDMIDFLVVADYNYSYPNLRVEEFSAFCKGHCKLYAQMGDMLGGVWKGKPEIHDRGLASIPGGKGYNSMILTDEEARACAANHYRWGADGIAFWNIACSIGTRGAKVGPEQRSRMLDWMNEVINPQKLFHQPRTYHYLPLYKGMKEKAEKKYAVCAKDCSPMGACYSQSITLREGRRQIFAFRMADGSNGGAVKGTLKFRIIDWEVGCNLKLDINGKKIEGKEIKITKDPYNADINAYWYEIKLANNCSFNGDNELGLILEQANKEHSPYMEELIIEVI